MTDTTTVYVIRERNGEDYWTGSQWSPASNEACEYDTRSEAYEAGLGQCEARDWKVLARDVS